VLRGWEWGEEGENGGRGEWAKAWWVRSVKKMCAREGESRDLRVLEGVWCFFGGFVRERACCSWFVVCCERLGRMLRDWERGGLKARHGERARNLKRGRDGVKERLQNVAYVA